MDKTFDFMNIFLKLGEMTAPESESIDEKVAYKERIIFATMKSMIPNWEEPKDWDKISNEEKLSRLNKIEQMNI